MAWIEVIHDDDADDLLRDVYRRIAGTRGKVSNIMRVQSLHPVAMGAHLDLYTAALFDRAGLRRAERELIAVVVSTTNGCEYCVNHHSEALRAYWKDESRIAQVVRDYRNLELTERERALCDYAVTLTRSPASLRESDVARLREAGLSDREILDANLVASYFNFVNRVANGLGVAFTEDEVTGYRY